MTLSSTNTAFKSSIDLTSHEIPTNKTQHPPTNDQSDHPPLPKTIKIHKKKKPKNTPKPTANMIHNYYMQKYLHSWLKTQWWQASLLPTTDPDINQTKSQSNPSLTQPTTTEANTQTMTTTQATPVTTIYQSTLLPPEQLNEHWGDLPTHMHNMFRLIMKNINTISAINRFVQWKATVHAADQLHADILCLLEPNTNWHPNITSHPTEIIGTIKDLNLIQLRQQR